MALTIFSTIRLWLNVVKIERTYEPKNIFHLKLEGGTSGAMMVETDKEKLRG